MTLTKKQVTFTTSTEKVLPVNPGAVEWGLVIVGPYSNTRHITENIPGLAHSHSMKVMELQAWYLDWSTKPADTRRDMSYALT